MGISDRDYWRERPGSPQVGKMAGYSVATWLIIVNVAVFVLDHLLFARPAIMETEQGRVRTLVPDLIYPHGYFSFTKAIRELEIWRFITFQFIHADFAHLFGNMLGLFVFGRMIEEFLGRRRFLAFYLLCGCTGPIAYLLLQRLQLLVYHPDTPLVGASAGVFGVLAAGATLAPALMVQLIFPPMPIRLRTLAFVLMGVAIASILLRWQNAGGEAAHLGGMALGYWLIRHPRYLNWADPARGPRLAR
jgi:membrane associated rhomboid family serine protease